MPSRSYFWRWVLALSLLWMTGSGAWADHHPGFTVLKSQPSNQEDPKQKLGDAPAAEDSEAASVEELIQHHDQLRKTYDGINSGNPLSADFGKKQNSAYTNPTVEKVQKILNHPIAKKYAKVLSNPHLIQGVAQIATHPDRQIITYSELALILCLIFFRTWRFSKCTSVLGRIWVNLYTTPIYLMTSLVVIPAIVIGDPYVNTLTELIHSLAV